MTQGSNGLARRRLPAHRIVITLLSAATAALGCSERALDLEELLARHAQARGGESALEAVQGLRVELHVSEPEFAVEISYQAMRPQKARVDVTIEGDTVFTEGFDGSQAWQLPGGAAEPVVASPEGTAALRRGAIGNLYGLHELPGLGHELELLERTEIDGVFYYTVRLTYDDGFVEHLYVDPESFLVTRTRDVHALHPDIDSTERRIESRSSDFRTVDGIVRSFAASDWDLDTGERLQAVTIRSVELNPALDPSVFEMPESDSGDERSPK